MNKCHISYSYTLEESQTAANVNRHCFSMQGKKAVSAIPVGLKCETR
jgi:hypothetical protein